MSIGVNSFIAVSPLGPTLPNTVALAKKTTGLARRARVSGVKPAIVVSPERPVSPLSESEIKIPECVNQTDLNGKKFLIIKTVQETSLDNVISERFISPLSESVANNHKVLIIKIEEFSEIKQTVQTRNNINLNYFKQKENKRLSPYNGCYIHNKIHGDYVAKYPCIECLYPNYLEDKPKNNRGKESKLEPDFKVVSGCYSHQKYNNYTPNYTPIYPCLPCSYPTEMNNDTQFFNTVSRLENEKSYLEDKSKTNQDEVNNLEPDFKVVSGCYSHQKYNNYTPIYPCLSCSYPPEINNDTEHSNEVPELDSFNKNSKQKCRKIISDWGLKSKLIAKIKRIKNR